MKTKLTIALGLFAVAICIVTYLTIIAFTRSHIIAIPFTGMLGATLTLVIISNLLMYYNPDSDIKDVAENQKQY